MFDAFINISGYCKECSSIKFVDRLVCICLKCAKPEFLYSSHGGHACGWWLVRDYLDISDFNHTRTIYQIH